MDRVKRAPISAVTYEVLDKIDRIFMDSIEAKLLDFIADNHADVRIKYNAYEIIVISNNIVEWNRRLHDKFCKEFHLILYQLERREKLNYELLMNETTVIFVYIAKSLKEKFNKEYGLDVDTAFREVL